MEDHDMVNVLLPPLSNSLWKIPESSVWVCWPISNKSPIVRQLEPENIILKLVDKQMPFDQVITNMNFYHLQYICSILKILDFLIYFPFFLTVHKHYFFVFSQFFVFVKNHHFGKSPPKWNFVISLTNKKNIRKPFQFF